VNNINIGRRVLRQETNVRHCEENCTLALQEYWELEEPQRGGCMYLAKKNRDFDALCLDKDSIFFFRTQRVLVKDFLSTCSDEVG
jgi:hypothetical protein